MEFGQLMADILVHVSCKFEMNIFEMAQVIGENVPIAFLYVLSIEKPKLPNLILPLNGPRSTQDHNLNKL